MAQRRRPVEKIVMRMTQEERDLILAVPLANLDHGNRLKPVRGRDHLIAGYTKDELEDLCGFAAAEANHTPDRDLAERLNDLCDHLEDGLRLLNNGVSEE